MSYITTFIGAVYSTPGRQGSAAAFGEALPGVIARLQAQLENQTQQEEQ